MDFHGVVVRELNPFSPDTSTRTRWPLLNSLTMSPVLPSIFVTRVRLDSIRACSFHHTTIAIALAHCAQAHCPPHTTAVTTATPPAHPSLPVRQASNQNCRTLPPSRVHSCGKILIDLRGRTRQRSDCSRERADVTGVVATDGMEPAVWV